MDVTLGCGGIAERLNERARDWSTIGMIAAAYALAIGAASAVVDAADAADGSAPALGRVALGLVGLAGGALLWARKDQEVLGWRIALVWAIVQIPVIAWDADGSVTTQIVRFPLMATSETRINGVVTSASEFGINLLAIVLAGIYARRQGEALVRRG